MAGLDGEEHRWFFMTRLPPDLILHVHGSTFHLHKFPMVFKCGKLAEILSETPQNEPLHLSLADIPGDAETLEIVVKFCYGYEPYITLANFISLYALSSYLEMTESVCHNNLRDKTMAFFHNTVLLDWNNCILVLRSCQEREKLSSVQKPLLISIISGCLNSVADMVSGDPSLIGPPLQKVPTSNLSQKITNSRKRKLFDSIREQLTSLEIEYYELVMLSIMERNVPSEFVAGSLVRYVRERLLMTKNDGGVDHDTIVVPEENSFAEILETVERMIPVRTPMIPCKYLVQWLRWATVFQASDECRENLERRVGKQLDQAALEDLLIPSSGYTQETKYDIECISRILASFCENCRKGEIQTVASVCSLVDELLLEVSKDEKLSPEDFAKLIENSPRDSSSCSDGLYRAIDTFFYVHIYLTETEKERICQVLNCRNLTPEACTHAMLSKRMPLRPLTNIIFVGQLHLRDAIINCDNVADIDKARGDHSNGGSRNSCYDDEEVRNDGVMVDMESVEMRITELERKSSIMKEDINNVGRREKRRLWKKFKDVLGCGQSNTALSSHLNKIHPV